jgi:hypothetical protein
MRGPVSRMSAIARPAGIIASAPKRSSEARVCTESTTPTATPAVMISGAGAVPELIRMSEDFAQFIGRTSRFDDGVRAERGDRAGQFKDAERAGAKPVDE